MAWKNIGINEEGDFVFVDTERNLIAYDENAVRKEIPTADAILDEYSDTNELLEILCDGHVVCHHA